jgi:hypothetical protein
VILFVAINDAQVLSTGIVIGASHGFVLANTCELVAGISRARVGVIANYILVSALGSLGIAVVNSALIVV